MSLHVRKGDTVKILTGKDKGKTGKITMVDPDSGRIVVENLNIIIKHTKARGAGKQSSIQKVAGSIDASNVQIICPACDKTTRVAHTEIDGKKPGSKKWQRTCKKCGATLDVKAEKKPEKKTKKAKKEETPETPETPVTPAAGEKKPVRKTAKPKVEKNEDGAVV